MNSEKNRPLFVNSESEYLSTTKAKISKYTVDDELEINGYAITSVSNSTSLGIDAAALPTQYAVKTYVDSQVAGKDTFLELNDTPSSYTANTLMRTNTAGDALITTSTLIDDGVTNANSLAFSTGTTTFRVNNNCLIDQNLSTTSAVNHTSLKLGGIGGTIGEFSTDGTMAGDSDTAVPTEKGVKTYVDTQVATKDSFLKLTDTPSSYTANTLMRSNAAGDALVTTSTTIDDGVSSANTLALTTGTTTFTVSADSAINQNLTTTSDPTFNAVTVFSLDVVDNTDPFIKLYEGGDKTGGYSYLKGQHPTIAEYGHYSVTGNPSVVEVNPKVQDGTSNVDFKVFRSTTTSGNRAFGIFRGDGTFNQVFAVTGGTPGALYVYSQAPLNVDIIQPKDYTYVSVDGVQVDGTAVANSFTLVKGTTTITCSSTCALNQNLSTTSAVNHTSLKLGGIGGTIGEFSTDGTLAGDSDTAVPTEKAVKTYTDGKFTSGSLTVYWKGPYDVYRSDITYKKTNNVVTLTTLGLSRLGNSTANYITAVDVSEVTYELPADLWPTTPRRSSIQIMNNAAVSSTPGTWSVDASGNMYIYSDWAAGTFTATAGLVGFMPASITYAIS